MWLLLLLGLHAQGDRMIAPGASVQGTLTDSSPPAPGGRRAEFFGFRCLSGLAIQLDVVSDWDNLAFILAADGRTVAQDDDAGGANNARIAWTCPDNQLYRIGVSSYHAGTGGAFTLRVAATNEVGGPPTRGFAPGAVARVLDPEADVRGMLAPGSSRYLNHPVVYYGLRCRTGLTVQIDAQSGFDNLLYVFDAAGVTAMNDDGPNGTNAHLVLTCPDAGAYRIGVAAQRPDDTGPFRLFLRNLTTAQVPRTPMPPRGGGVALYPGAVVEGVLHPDAPVEGGRPAVLLPLQCQAGLPLRIDVTSTWDNMAFVLAPSGARVAAGDDADGTTNARIAWRCPDGQVYRVGVAAANPATGGAFTLSVQPTGVAPVVEDTRGLAGTLYQGARVTGNLLASAPRFLERPADIYALQCVRGQTLQLDMRSAFDNLLAVMNSTGRVLASNDDARGTNASLTWACPDAAQYRVGAGTRSGMVGRYLLTVR